MYQCVLFLVLPLHVLLLIPHWIPPHVQQTFAELGTLDEETAEVKTATILGDYDIDALRPVVPDRRFRQFVEIEKLVLRRWVRDVQGIVDVDVTICDVLEVFEDVVLQGDARLHDESMQIKPPEPLYPSVS